MNEEEEQEEEEYQRVLDQILQAIDDEDVDNVIPALVTTLSCVMCLHDIPKTVMLRFITDAFDRADEKEEKQ
jgi:CRISPR/Cas system CSM-associated protein Csm2 small subunit